MLEHLQAVRQVDRLVDTLKLNLPDEYKRRDPKEPGRQEKEAYEDKLAGLVQRRFNAQKKAILAEAAKFSLDAPGIEAKMLSLVIEMAMHGLNLFVDSQAIGIDYGVYSIETVNIAKEYVGQMITNIDETTLTAVQEALNTYANTPGMTLKQLEGMLPFEGYRARSIAVTETTNLYAGVEERLGRKLAADYPDMRVVKTWYTNNDDIVRRCPICWPLHNVTVGIDEQFAGGLDKPPGHPNCRCWMSTRTVIDE